MSSKKSKKRVKTDALPVWRVAKRDSNCRWCKKLIPAGARYLFGIFRFTDPVNRYTDKDPEEIAGPFCSRECLEQEEQIYDKFFE